MMYLSDGMVFSYEKCFGRVFNVLRIYLYLFNLEKKNDYKNSMKSIAILEMSKYTREKTGRLMYLH